MSADPPALKTLSVEEARGRMLAAVGALGAETVALEQAAGRVLAGPVLAVRDQPPFNASAMDGYACRSADLPAPLILAGESAAGCGYAQTLTAGQAVRIFTGAPVPEGADFVVIQEEAERDGDRVTLRPHGGDNIRRQGCDFRAGKVLLEAGIRLDAWRLALAASAGCGTLSVVRRPLVAVLATGAEIVPPGQVAAPHQIYNSSGAALRALIEAWGGEPLILPLVGDEEAAIRRAVDGLECDLLVTVGGASVGDHDLVKPALGRIGLVLDVETIALRPGKPTWFGRLGDGRAVLGLPGNPASGLVCAELFLRPLIGKLSGGEPGPRLSPARLAVAMPANGPREHWLRARLNHEAGGVLSVAPMEDQDSSLVSVFANAGALLRRAPNAAAAQVGDIAEVLKLDRA